MEWINKTDRLPEAFGAELLVTDGQIIMLAEWRNGFIYESDYSPIPDNEITHWMYLYSIPLPK